MKTARHTALSLFTKDWVRSVDDRTQVVDRLRHKYEDHDEDMLGTCRHAALLVTNNALCLMSGLLSGI